MTEIEEKLKKEYVEMKHPVIILFITLFILILLSVLLPNTPDTIASERAVSGGASDLQMIIIFIFIHGICSAILCAFIASQKERDVIGWFVLGFLFGIFSIIGIAAVPSLKK
jgi:cytochrome bd-type quinol oxidase subunit 2